jgi:hypothetical protein
MTNILVRLALEEIQTDPKFVGNWSQWLFISWKCCQISMDAFIYMHQFCRKMWAFLMKQCSVILCYFHTPINLEKKSVPNSVVLLTRDSTVLCSPIYDFFSIPTIYNSNTLKGSYLWRNGCFIPTCYKLEGTAKRTWRTLIRKHIICLRNSFLPFNSWEWRSFAYYYPPKKSSLTKISLVL